MNKIISVDLKADFGFLKKPDTNDPIYLTFNMLHKPALLGILGAIIGLEGFSEAKKEVKGRSKGQDKINREEFLPAYYQKLKNLKVGIRPLNFIKNGQKIEEDQFFNGNFQKTTIKYNNSVGYANLDGGNLLVTEQTLIRPSYRCYLLLEDEELHQKLYDYLKNSKAEYLPYMGKNDFSLWWDKENFKEYDFKPFLSTEKFSIKTIFIKSNPVKEGLREMSDLDLLTGTEGCTFVYFENLPVSYNLDLMQYDYKPFSYTDWYLQQHYPVHHLYELDNNEIIQLF
ncbi:MAG: type I-B CRISPR-associated protein Cas5 [Bacteroidales bacterium]|nr:type I-B CRISPR-associated protein Cas5 [Bacteroidales bacterium]